LFKRLKRLIVRRTIYVDWCVTLLIHDIRAALQHDHGRRSSKKLRGGTISHIGDVKMSTTLTSENIDRTVSGLKDGMASATVGLEQAQATMRDGMQKAMKSAEDMFAFSQGNLEAVAKSSQIWATGMQTLSQSFATAAKASMEETMGMFKAMSGIKSVKDAIDLQTSLVRSTMEKAVSQTGQLADTSMKLSEQAFAPISARLTLAAEKFGRVG
jgi:phasin family protein